MKTYKDITAGSVGSQNNTDGTNGSAPTSDFPAKDVVDGEALNHTLDTGVAPIENSSVRRCNYPMDRRNGQL